jgi:hypothetical protein
LQTPEFPDMCSFEGAQRLVAQVGQPFERDRATKCAAALRAPSTTEASHCLHTAAHSARLAKRQCVIAGFVVGVIALAAGNITLDWLRAKARVDSWPMVAAVDIATVFPTPGPVRITTTAGWLKAPMTVPATMLISDHRLWLRMHFDDWDTVPPLIRHDGLSAMASEYRHVLRAPREWDRMAATDWDLIPQPIRAIAFMNMIRYWSGHYQVGARHGLSRGTTTDTLNAIVMVESWFEHRAVSTSRSGNRDLGLGQASDYARATMAGLSRNGWIDFAPESEASYFNPWVATRMTAIWFNLMIEEQRGNLDASIRAYHQGSRQVDSAAAEAYLANVLQKRRRFMRQQIGTPSWQLLMKLSHDQDVVSGLTWLFADDS